jgi:hypothetical protein
MNKLHLILGFFGILLLSSMIENTVTDKDVVGTYGDLQSHFIILNENHTFDYANFMKHKKVEFHGTWKLENGMILFSELNTKKSIPTKWLVLDNGTRLQTKKGLTTYTLGGNCK